MNPNKALRMTQFSKNVKTVHVNATKSYLHFDHFAGDATLRSNFFCFFIVFRCLISFMKIELLHLQSRTKSQIVCFNLYFSNQWKTQFHQNVSYDFVAFTLCYGMP